MNKPRIYWCPYPGLGRGYWRVRPKNLKAKRTSPDWQARRYAYALVAEMNRAEDRRIDAIRKAAKFRGAH